MNVSVTSLLVCNQPRSQGLSSLPPLVVGTETLVAAGHVTTQGGTLNDRMLPATIVFVFGVLLMKVTVFTRNQQAELVGASSHEEQTENVRKPCVDQKKRC